MVTSIAVVLLAAGQTGGVQIRWSPRVGEVHSMTYRSEAKPANSVYGGDMEFRVAGIEGGKIHVVRTFSNKKLTGDVDPDEAPGQDPDIVHFFFAPNGDLIHEIAEKMWGTDYQQDQSFVFIYPPKTVAIGASWTRKMKAHDEFPGCESVYTYKGIEPIGEERAFRVDVAFKETEGRSPTTATGSFWLSRFDGWPIKIELKSKSMPWWADSPQEAIVTLKRK